MAERLGVNAEPELLTMAISAKERLIVIASDGIFDVVSNQEVIDLCFRHRDDPAWACISLVDNSHKEWLLNDDCDENKANYECLKIKNISEQLSRKNIIKMIFVKNKVINYLIKYNK